ncbi:MAG: OmpA family protein [Proteobacteria bacterium]|nr:OmpA family protein [Pseudomonadota bacterium]
MGLSRLRCITGLFAIAVLLAGSIAQAKDKPLLENDHGMDTRLFRSAVDTKGHVTQDAAPVLPHLAFSIGLMLDFGFNQWPAAEQQGDVYKTTQVDTYIASNLLVNLGLIDMIVIGFQLPLIIPSGTGYHGDAQKRGWSSKGGIGDIAIHAKLRWIRADRHPVGLGTVIQYQIPVSSKSEWLIGDPVGGALNIKMILDSEPLKWYRVALNVGAHIPFGFEEDNRLNEDFVPDDPDQDQTYNRAILFKYGPLFTFGIGQSFTLWEDILDFVLEFYGTHLFSKFTDTAYLSTEINAGFKLYIERNSYLLAGYAHGLPTADTGSKYGFQSVEHRFFIGFAFEPSIGDRDHDGIKDDVDQCPDDPEDRDDFEDSDGCPDPDNDQDGILDVNDDCPLVPEDFDGDNDEDGCPEQGSNDRDGDGILDEVDQCPDDPEDLDGFEDQDGCPDPDNDQDGILDVDDMCPNEPEDMDGFEDRNGCPDPDNDNDRILDVNDLCPNEPETYNGKDDTDGCPDQGDVLLTGTDIKILKKIYFEYDSAVIKRVSFNILDAVAATIVNNPQIDLIEIQGHADERGNDNYNQRLTADRASAVKRYLVARGVGSEKVDAKGYGEYCPVDSASNEAAWEKNRRVEFKVMKINGMSTGVAGACEKAKQMGL